MRILGAFLLLTALPAVSSSSRVDELATPTAIRTCMESPPLRGYRVDPRVNPYYLRGDFDGDNKADYAVMIIRPKREPSGLAICQGDGRIFVRGAGSEPKFSTKKDDNFLSSNWEVLTQAKFREYACDKKKGALARGEVISLNWEDGTGFVFYNGSQYRWFEEPAGCPAS